MSDRRVLVIAGPTAVGKTDLTLEVASTTGAEVVVADSRQIYRRLDVGTAKPTEADRRRVRHHLVDALDPEDETTAGRWHEAFLEVWRDAGSRNTPLVVTGGSTLYLDVVINGPSDLPAVSADVRHGLEAEYARDGGPDALFRELHDRDPAIAATLDPTKRSRLVRYLGAVRETGLTPSDVHASTSRPAVEAELVVLFRPRAELYARIDRRVDRMVEDGLVAEARALVDGGNPAVLGATIGYQELLPVFEGRRDLEDGVRLIKRNTRRYAKRQLTWFRRYPSARWIDARVASPDRVLEVVSPWPTTA